MNRGLSLALALLAVTFGALTLSTTGGGSSTNAQDTASSVELDGLPANLVADYARGRLYVSVPSDGEIVVFDASTLAVLDRIEMPAKAPVGLALSIDGTRLFAALNQAGAVAVIDLQTLAWTEIVVGIELGSSLAWDVIEAKPGTLFVTGNPGSGGFAHLVQVRLGAPNVVSRVTAGGIIRAAPILVASHDQAFLYVGEGFSPNSLYKFDIATDTPVKVLEDQHGTISGTSAMDISHDGARIYLASGQVLRTDSFLQDGLVSGGGVPRVSIDGNRLYYGRGTNVHVHDRATLAAIDQFPTNCGQAIDIEPFADDTGVFVVTGTALCRVSFVHEPSPTPTPNNTPVIISGSTDGKAKALRGFSGTLDLPDGPVSGGVVAFDRRLGSARYALLVTEIGSRCSVVVTEKRVSGFTFACRSGEGGGTLDWLVVPE